MKGPERLQYTTIEAFIVMLRFSFGATKHGVSHRACPSALEVAAKEANGREPPRMKIQRDFMKLSDFLLV